MWRVDVAVVAGLTVAAAGCGSPKPAFEYGPTETYTSTARDPTPRPVAAEPSGVEPLPTVPSAVEPSPTDETVDETAAEQPAPEQHTADDPSDVVDPAPPASEPEAPAGNRWYKAKPW